MKRVGICTMYYNNPNYGAVLQAYALNKVVTEMGYDSEMISFYQGTEIRHFLSRIKREIKKNDSFYNQILLRFEAVRSFSETIPHSKLYYPNTLHRANERYDTFIVGSDQVWNPDWINAYYALDFVIPPKNTIAYAASLGRISLNDEQREKLRGAVERTKHISVREEDSIPALSTITRKKVECVLDPTMLLTKKEWDSICMERMYQGDYMFCYFLGNNENLRKTATAYAHRRGMKIVSFPFLNCQYREVDDNFGDIRLYDVSPRGFLSLIKNASFVMTDSFHGAVFSHIFDREFAVSSDIRNEMGCRIRSLTELFGTGDRYYSDHEQLTLKKLINMEEKPIKLEYDHFERMRHKSLSFLSEALRNA